MTVWPAGNFAGQGEIDLELLGGVNTDIIQCPIWAPGHGTPIVYANEPSSWGSSDPSGPTVDYGLATCVDALVTSPATGIEMADIRRA